MSFQMSLKVETDWILRMLMGSEFQICGAEILKLRDPNDKQDNPLTYLKGDMQRYITKFMKSSF